MPLRQTVLVSFYVDYKYQNYVRITDPIAPDEYKDVSFKWVNTPVIMFTIKANNPSGG